MAILFTGITLDFVIIPGVGIFPKIYIKGLSRPSFVSGDFVILEKFTIPRANTEVMTLARQAISTQSILYYMNHNLANGMISQTFMSATLYMGRIDLTIDPVNTDVTQIINQGDSSIIDSETDLVNYTYIYRMYYRCNGTDGSSDYKICSESSTILNEYLNGNTDTSGPLYRYRTSGILVEKGVPMVHTTNRYRGPIESDKEEARRTAVYNTIEYIDSTLTDMDSKIDELYSGISAVSRKAISTVIYKVPEYEIGE